MGGVNTRAARLWDGPRELLLLSAHCPSKTDRKIEASFKTSFRETVLTGFHRREDERGWQNGDELGSSVKGTWGLPHCPLRVGVYAKASGRKHLFVKDTGSPACFPGGLGQPPRDPRWDVTVGSSRARGEDTPQPAPSPGHAVSVACVPAPTAAAPAGATEDAALPPSSAASSSANWDGNIELAKLGPMAQRRVRWWVACLSSF